MTVTPDPHNANVGTMRGGALLAESVAACGFGRPILADAHGVVIAGNKTLAAAGDAPLELVDTAGHELVVVQRTDLDLLTDAKARQLAYYDNRVREVDLSWSPLQVQADVLAGVPLDLAFFPSELAEFTVQAAPNPPHSLKDTPQSLKDTSAFDALPLPVTDPEPSLTVSLTFDTADQHAHWQDLMGRLALRYPGRSPGAALAQYLREPACP